MIAKSEDAGPHNSEGMIRTLFILFLGIVLKEGFTGNLKWQWVLFLGSTLVGFSLVHRVITQMQKNS